MRHKPRLDRGKSRTITLQLADLIERLKRENPHRTGTTLLRDLAVSGRGTTAISASTLYRFLKQRSLSERQLIGPSAHKKFEAEHSNQIWQLDIPYLQRRGGGKMQGLLHAILDDASRERQAVVRAGTDGQEFELPVGSARSLTDEIRVR